MDHTLCLKKLSTRAKDYPDMCTRWRTKLGICLKGSWCGIWEGVSFTVKKAHSFICHGSYHIRSRTSRRNLRGWSSCLHRAGSSNGTLMLVKKPVTSKRCLRGLPMKCFHKHFVGVRSMGSCLLITVKMKNFPMGPSKQGIFDSWYAVVFWGVGWTLALCTQAVPFYWQFVQSNLASFMEIRLQ